MKSIRKKKSEKRINDIKMPEGPSIVILKEAILHFKGREIIQVTGNSKVGIQAFNNTVITDIRSFGKQLLISLNSGLTIRIHFMLFGSYSIDEKKDRPERLGIKTEVGEINFYACSVKIIEGNIEKMYDWQADVMSDVWNEKKAKEKIKGLGSELICDVLLDQKVFAGVGNIIKNEVLFRMKVQPESIVSKIPPRTLNRIIKDTRSYSFKFLEWKKEFILRKQWQVHTKKTCPRCNIPLIRKAHLGKTKRRAFYCQNCQVLYT